MLRLFGDHDESLKGSHNLACPRLKPNLQARLERALTAAANGVNLCPLAHSVSSWSFDDIQRMKQFTDVTFKEDLSKKANFDAVRHLAWVLRSPIKDASTLVGDANIASQCKNGDAVPSTLFEFTDLNAAN